MAKSLVTEEDLNAIVYIETINLEDKEEDGFVRLMNACELALRKYCRELKDLIRIYDENYKKFETSQEEFITNKLIGTSAITIGAIAGFGAVGFGIPGIVIGLIPSVAGGIIHYNSIAEFDKAKDQIVQELSKEPEKLQAEAELEKVAQELSRYLDDFESDESIRKKLEGIKYSKVNYKKIQYNHSLFGDNKFINNNISKCFKVFKDIEDKSGFVLKMYTKIENSLPSYVGKTGKFVGRNFNKLAITGTFILAIIDVASLVQNCRDISKFRRDVIEKRSKMEEQHNFYRDLIPVIVQCKNERKQEIIHFNNNFALMQLNARLSKVEQHFQSCQSDRS